MSGTGGQGKHLSWCHDLYTVGLLPSGPQGSILSSAGLLKPE